MLAIKIFRNESLAKGMGSTYEVKSSYFHSITIFQGFMNMEQDAQKIAITGATGFVGRELVTQLHGQGFEVVGLSREDVLLSPQDLALRLDGVFAVVNLAGAPVMQRWSAAYKKTMWASRVDVTHNLVAAFGVMPLPPQVFISTSATGIYADGGSHTEAKNSIGTSFLARLALAWEAEAVKAKEYGVRTLIFRFGVVLGPAGGPFAQMVLPFKWGLGGKIGHGLQPFSWIHLQDLIQAYCWALTDEKGAGIYNLVAPQPSTNIGMTKALGKALGRPTLFTVPGFILKMRFGEGAEILIGGQRALPERLLAAGFKFTYATIERAMEACVRGG